jgi:hypothetical protein
MNDEIIFNKNLTLSTEFSRYVLEHPKFAEKIPENAQVILLPEYDPDLCKVNLEIAKKQREKRQPVVYVHVEKLKPPKSRLVNPRIEFEKA